MSEMQKALEYYRAALERRKPTWVPARVSLRYTVRGDFPIGHTTIAPAGEHEAHCNQWGAVTVRGLDGKQLGIKPDEFDVIAWRENT